MDKQIATLDIASFPLDGLSMIEASAGTGKTFTVSNLVLRYVLEKKYSIEEILVVTFTEAATQELRIRIRGKIAECSSLIERVLEEVEPGQGVSGSQLSEQDFKALGADSLLALMLRRSENLAEDLLRLRIAEQSVDLAEIHTIHGFCQKVAREHAVLMNLPSEQVLKEDLKPEWLDACRDLWRGQILKFPESALKYVRCKWASPDVLNNHISIFTHRQAERITPHAPSHENEGGDSPLQWWLKQYEKLDVWHESLVTLLSAHLAEIKRVVADSDLKLVNNKLKGLDAMQSWLDNGANPVEVTKLKFENFFESKISVAAKKGKQAPQHLFFVTLEQHFEHQPRSLESLFLQAFYLETKQRVDRKKQAEQLLGFDDLIRQVNEAVLNPDLAHSLVAQLRKKYRVALIDEFQDTDALQYPVFSRIFGTGAQQSSPSHAPSLVLIGDPKQAIYGFRGGDMATYLRARSDVLASDVGNVFTMRDNWRSSVAVLDAFNTLYSTHEKPFLEREIPYVEVCSGTNMIKPEWGAGLYIDQICNETAEGKRRNKENTQEALASICAKRLLSLLGNRPLQIKSSDITILVRDRTEASLMQRHLLALGVKSSFDNKQSIFQSEEALSVYKLLFAAQNPSSERAVLQCLSDPLWGLSDQCLMGLQQNELEAYEWLERMREMAQRWKDHGVLSAIRRALVDLGVLEHWQGSEDHALLWERRLSNIGQVAELLQAQSTIVGSPASLLHWFAKQLVEDDTSLGKAREIRLESDDQLVRIVTIHSSKGLEYPVVFIPFLFSGKKISAPVWFYDDLGRLSLALEPDEAEKSAAEKESLAEDCRLLYVALTRAKYRCYVGTSEFSGNALRTHATGFGYLLLNGESPENLDGGWLRSRLETLAEHEAVDYQFWTEEDICPFFMDGSEYTSQTYTALEALPKRFAPAVTSSWRVQSFTGLMNEHHRLHPQSHSSLSGVMSTTLSPNQIHILNFPKGANAGTFLHTLFEHLDFETGGLLAKYARSGESLEQHIESLLTRKQLVPESRSKLWAEYLANWLQRILSLDLAQGQEKEQTDGDELAPRQGESVCLGSLRQEDYIVEAEFHFRVGALKAPELNKVLRAFRADAPHVGFDQFTGHIKGAIDLTFRHGDRYYLLDYKSNHLGFEVSDYRHEQLESAIMDHRYDLQYLLYSVALHRLLRHRLGSDYDYRRHFGGVYYLFLRGMELADHPTEGLPDSELRRGLPGVYFVKPEQALIEGLDALLERAGNG